MTTRDFIQARMAFTREDLNRVLTRLADEDMLWAPREGMNTIGALLCEIARKDMEIVGWLRNGEWPDDEPDPFDATSATLEQARSGLEQTRINTIAYLDSLTDEQVDEIIVVPEPWWETLRLVECPRSEMLRNASAHEWYHTGQLVTYLWLRGDDPGQW